jgi:hypothetical protein
MHVSDFIARSRELLCVGVTDNARGAGYEWLMRAENWRGLQPTRRFPDPSCHCGPFREWIERHRSASLTNSVTRHFEVGPAFIIKVCRSLFPVPSHSRGLENEVCERKRREEQGDADDSKAAADCRR